MFCRPGGRRNQETPTYSITNNSRHEFSNRPYCESTIERTTVVTVRVLYLLIGALFWWCHSLGGYVSHSILIFRFTGEIGNYCQWQKVCTPVRLFGFRSTSIAGPRRPGRRLVLRRPDDPGQRTRPMSVDVHEPNSPTPCPGQWPIVICDLRLNSVLPRRHQTYWPKRHEWLEQFLVCVSLLPRSEISGYVRPFRRFEVDMNVGEG